MAKAATKVEKKKKKPAAAASARAKVVKKPAGKKAKKAKKASAPKKEHKGLEALARLADHPLVADLLAAGAIAAVAAIADQQLGESRSTSSKMVKAAGQAAATAIGKKLMDEFGAVKDAATKAAKKA